MITMNRQLHIHFSITCIAISCFAYLFYKYPYSLGGSLVLCLFISAFIPLTLRIIKLSSEFRLTQLILADIVGINFLSYLENSVSNTSILYLFIFYSCILFLLYFYSTIADPGFKKYNQINTTDQNLLKQIRLTLAVPLFFVGFVFSLFSGLMVHFIHEYEPQIYYGNPYLRISCVSIAFLIFFFFISFIYLRKINDEDIKELLSKADEKYNLKIYDGRKMKNYTLLIYAGTFIIGSGIEIQRGMWIMWFETIILLGLMMLILWKIYKHLFSEGSTSKEGE